MQVLQYGIYLKQLLIQKKVCGTLSKISVMIIYGNVFFSSLAIDLEENELETFKLALNCSENGSLVSVFVRLIVVVYLDGYFSG